MNRREYVRLFCALFVSMFLLFFIGNTIADKFTGWKTKLNPAYHEPITWKEYFDELPELFITSVFVSVFLSIIFTGVGMEVHKKQKKDIEAARKRIEERERNSRKENVRNEEAEVEIDGNENVDR